MAIEIERRFLVRDPRAAFTAAGMTRGRRISQGYFGQIDGLRVHVRILSDLNGDRAALLALKSVRLGLCRLEYEYPLPLDRARHAPRCLPSSQIIRKVRYKIRHDDGLVWSVDRSLGPNTGLVLAEVEFTHPDQHCRAAVVGRPGGYL